MDIFNEKINLINKHELINIELNLIEKNIEGCQLTVIAIIFMQILNLLVYYTDLKDILFKNIGYFKYLFWINLFLIFILSTLISHEKFKNQIPYWLSFSSFAFIYLTGWFLTLFLQINTVDGTFNISFMIWLSMILIYYLFYIIFTNINKFEYNIDLIYKSRLFYIWNVVIIIFIISFFYSILLENKREYNFIIFLLIIWKKVKETNNGFNINNDVENKYNRFNLAIMNFSYSYGVLFWYGLYLNFYYYDLVAKVN